MPARPPQTTAGRELYREYRRGAVGSGTFRRGLAQHAAHRTTTEPGPEFEWISRMTLPVDVQPLQRSQHPGSVCSGTSSSGVTTRCPVPQRQPGGR